MNKRLLSVTIIIVSSWFVLSPWNFVLASGLNINTDGSVSIGTKADI